MAGRRSWWLPKFSQIRQPREASKTPTSDAAMLRSSRLDDDRLSFQKLCPCLPIPSSTRVRLSSVRDDTPTIQEIQLTRQAQRKSLLSMRLHFNTGVFLLELEDDFVDGVSWNI